MDIDFTRPLGEASDSAVNQQEAPVVSAPVTAPLRNPLTSAWDSFISQLLPSTIGQPVSGLAQWGLGGSGSQVDKLGETLGWNPLGTAAQQQLADTQNTPYWDSQKSIGDNVKNFPAVLSKISADIAGTLPMLGQSALLSKGAKAVLDRLGAVDPKIRLAGEIVPPLIYMILMESKNGADTMTRAGVDPDIVSAKAREYGTLAGVEMFGKSLLAAGSYLRAADRMATGAQAGVLEAVNKVVGKVPEPVVLGAIMPAMSMTLGLFMKSAESDMKARHGDSWIPKPGYEQPDAATLVESAVSGMLLGGAMHVAGHFARIMQGKTSEPLEQLGNETIEGFKKPITSETEAWGLGESLVRLQDATIKAGKPMVGDINDQIANQRQQDAFGREVVTSRAARIQLNALTDLVRKGDRDGYFNELQNQTKVMIMPDSVAADIPTIMKYAALPENDPNRAALFNDQTGGSRFIAMPMSWYKDTGRDPLVPITDRLRPIMDFETWRDELSRTTLTKEDISDPAVFSKITGLRTVGDDGKVLTAASELYSALADKNIPIRYSPTNVVHFEDATKVPPEFGLPLDPNRKGPITVDVTGMNYVKDGKKAIILTRYSGLLGLAHESIELIGKVDGKSSPEARQRAADLNRLIAAETTNWRAGLDQVHAGAYRPDVRDANDPVSRSKILDELAKATRAELDTMPMRVRGNRVEEKKRMGGIINQLSTNRDIGPGDARDFQEQINNIRYQSGLSKPDEMASNLLANFYGAGAKGNRDELFSRVASLQELGYAERVKDPSNLPFGLLGLTKDGSKELRRLMTEAYGERFAAGIRNTREAIAAYELLPEALVPKNRIEPIRLSDTPEERAAKIAQSGRGPQMTPQEGQQQGAGAPRTDDRTTGNGKTAPPTPSAVPESKKPQTAQERVQESIDRMNAEKFLRARQTVANQGKPESSTHELDDLVSLRQEQETGKPRLDIDESATPIPVEQLVDADLAVPDAKKPPAAPKSNEVDLSARAEAEQFEANMRSSSDLDESSLGGKTSMATEAVEEGARYPIEVDDLPKSAKLAYDTVGKFDSEATAFRQTFDLAARNLGSQYVAERALLDFIHTPDSRLAKAFTSEQAFRAYLNSSAKEFALEEKVLWAAFRTKFARRMQIDTILNDRGSSPELREKAEAADRAATDSKGRRMFDWNYFKGMKAYYDTYHPVESFVHALKYDANGSLLMEGLNKDRINNDNSAIFEASGKMTAIAAMLDKNNSPVGDTIRQYLQKARSDRFGGSNSREHLVSVISYFTELPKDVIRSAPEDFWRDPETGAGIDNILNTAKYPTTKWVDWVKKAWLEVPLGAKEQGAMTNLENLFHNVKYAKGKTLFANNTKDKRVIAALPNGRLHSTLVGLEADIAKENDRAPRSLEQFVRLHHGIVSGKTSENVPVDGRDFFELPLKEQLRIEGIEASKGWVFLPPIGDKTDVKVVNIGERMNWTMEKATQMLDAAYASIHPDDLKSRFVDSVGVLKVASEHAKLLGYDKPENYNRRAMIRAFTILDMTKRLWGDKEGSFKAFIDPKTGKVAFDKMMQRGSQFNSGGVTLHAPVSVVFFALDNKKYGDILDGQLAHTQSLVDLINNEIGTWWGTDTLKPYMGNISVGIKSASQHVDMLEQLGAHGSDIYKQLAAFVKANPGVHHLADVTSIKFRPPEAKVLDLMSWKPGQKIDDYLHTMDPDNYSLLQDTKYDVFAENAKYSSQATEGNFGLPNSADIAAARDLMVDSQVKGRDNAQLWAEWLGKAEKNPESPLHLRDNEALRRQLIELKIPAHDPSIAEQVLKRLIPSFLRDFQTKMPRVMNVAVSAAGIPIPPTEMIGGRLAPCGIIGNFPEARPAEVVMGRQEGLDKIWKNAKLYPDLFDVDAKGNRTNALLPDAVRPFDGKWYINGSPILSVRIPYDGLQSLTVARYFKKATAEDGKFNKANISILPEENRLAKGADFDLDMNHDYIYMPQSIKEGTAQKNAYIALVMKGYSMLVKEEALPDSKLVKDGLIKAAQKIGADHAAEDVMPAFNAPGAGAAYARRVAASEALIGAAAKTATAHDHVTAMLNAEGILRVNNTGKVMSQVDLPKSFTVLGEKIDFSDFFAAQKDMKLRNRQKRLIGTGPVNFIVDDAKNPEAYKLRLDNKMFPLFSAILFGTKVPKALDAKSIGAFYDRLHVLRKKGVQEFVDAIGQLKPKDQSLYLRLELGDVYMSRPAKASLALKNKMDAKLLKAGLSKEDLHGLYQLYNVGNGIKKAGAQTNVNTLGSQPRDVQRVEGYIDGTLDSQAFSGSGPGDLPQRELLRQTMAPFVDAAMNMPDPKIAEIMNQLELDALKKKYPDNKVVQNLAIFNKTFYDRDTGEPFKKDVVGLDEPFKYARPHELPDAYWPGFAGTEERLAAFKAEFGKLEPADADLLFTNQLLANGANDSFRSRSFYSMVDDATLKRNAGVKDAAKPIAGMPDEFVARSKDEGDALVHVKKDEVGIWTATKGEVSQVITEEQAQKYYDKMPGREMAPAMDAPKTPSNAPSSPDRGRTFNIVGKNVPNAFLGQRSWSASLPEAEQVKRFWAAQPGKPGALGNPFVADDVRTGTRTRAEATEAFKQLFLERVAKDPAYRDWVLSLRDKNIGYYKPGEESIHLKPVQEWLASQPEVTPPPAPVAPSVSPVPEGKPVVVKSKPTPLTSFSDLPEIGIGAMAHLPEAQDISAMAHVMDPKGEADFHGVLPYLDTGHRGLHQIYLHNKWVRNAMTLWSRGDGERASKIIPYENKPAQEAVTMYMGNLGNLPDPAKFEHADDYVQAVKAYDANKVARRAEAIKIIGDSGVKNPEEALGKFVAIDRQFYDRIRTTSNKYVSQYTESTALPFIHNYINRVIAKMDPVAEAEAYRKLNLNNPHGKERVFNTFDELQAAGFKLAVTNPVDLMAIYAKQVGTMVTSHVTIHQAMLVRNASGEAQLVPEYAGAPHISPDLDYVKPTLQTSGENLAGERGVSAVAPKADAGLWTWLKSMTGKADLKKRGYKWYESPYDGYSGFWVHPDSTYVGEMMFTKPWDTKIAKTLDSVNNWGKFLTVSFSFFHPLALIEEANAALGGPHKLFEGGHFVWNSSKEKKWFAPFDTGKDFNGTFKQLLKDTNYVAFAQRNGLNMNPYMLLDTDRIRHDLTWVKDAAAKMGPTGKPLEWMADGIAAYEKFTTNHLWNGLFAKSKLYTFHTLLEDARLKAEKQGTTLDVETAAKEIAKMVNDMGGGIEFEQYKWGTPRTRQVAQWLAFAPDWILSNINKARAGLSMIPGFDFLGQDMSMRQRRHAATVYWPTMLAFMFAFPQAAQFAIYSLFGDKTKGDKPFALGNEGGEHTSLLPSIGKALSVDMTPMTRFLHEKLGFQGAVGFDPNHPSNRLYMRLAKQAYEILDLLEDPIKSFKNRSSVAVRVAIEEMTGENLLGHAYAFKEEPTMFHGLLSSSEGFIESRVGVAAQKFLPMPLLAYMGGQPVSFLAPMSKGMTYAKAKVELAKILETYANPGLYAKFSGVPEYEKKLDELGPAILDAAALNGVDVKNIMKEAKASVLTRWNQKFWQAMNRSDTSGLEEAALAIVRLHGGIEGINQSIRVKEGKMTDKVWTADKRAATVKYMNWARDIVLANERTGQPSQDAADHLDNQARLLASHVRGSVPE